MAETGLQGQVELLLQATNIVGSYPMSLVCTDQGLVVASAGITGADEDTAAFTSLFDDIVLRATRDLGFEAVDEVALLDRNRGRTVIRPLPVAGESRFFLVVQVPRNQTWRRNTNTLAKQLTRLLQHLVGEVEEAA